MPKKATTATISINKALDNAKKAIDGNNESEVLVQQNILKQQENADRSQANMYDAHLHVMQADECVMNHPDATLEDCKQARDDIKAERKLAVEDIKESMCQGERMVQASVVKDSENKHHILTVLGTFAAGFTVKYVYDNRQIVFDTLSSAVKKLTKG